MNPRPAAATLGSRAFLKKNWLESPPLEDVVISLADRLMTTMNNARKLEGRKS